MGNLKKKIEDMLSAVSFAEEGEFETARSFLERSKRVLLAVRKGQVDRKTFLYAINTCKRVGAELDVLYLSGSDAHDLVLSQCMDAVKESGIGWRLIERNGCLKQEIITYTNSEKDILFAITESADTLDADCSGKSRKLSEAWRSLKCPLVIVEDNASA